MNGSESRGGLRILLVLEDWGESMVNIDDWLTPPSLRLLGRSFASKWQLPLSSELCLGSTLLSPTRGPPSRLVTRTLLGRTGLVHCHRHSPSLLVFIRASSSDRVHYSNFDSTRSNEASKERSVGLCVLRLVLGRAELWRMRHNPMTTVLIFSRLLARPHLRPTDPRACI